MTINNIVATILFILPGFLSHIWTEKFSTSQNYKVSNIEKTAEIILFAIPVVTISLLILDINFKFKGLSGLAKTSVSFKFLICYLITSFIISLCVSYLWIKWIKSFIWNQIINKVREKENKPHIVSESPWDFLLSDGRTLVACVYPLGEKEKSLYGILEGYSKPPDTTKDLILLATDEFDSETINALNVPFKTLVDLQFKVVIELYDCNEMLANLESSSNN